MAVLDMKEKLMEDSVSSYQWIPTKEMWADGLTKEMEMTDGLRRMIKNGTCMMDKKEVNKIVYEKGEIKMLNIRNRKQEE